MVTISGAVPAFFHHVINIVLIRPQEEVFWVDASPVVAFMANE